MPEPTDKELQKMQKEAEQRMREMQRRTAKYSGSSDIPPVPNFVRVGAGHGNHRSAPIHIETNHHHSPHNNQNHPSSNKKAPTGLAGKGFDLLKMFNFGNFKFDSDITIIVVLILLLSSEETDELLLLALAYIML